MITHLVIAEIQSRVEGGDVEPWRRRRDSQQVRTVDDRLRIRRAVARGPGPLEVQKRAFTHMADTGNRVPGVPME